MKKKFIFATIMLTVCFKSFAQMAEEDLVGVWLLGKYEGELYSSFNRPDSIVFYSDQQRFDTQDYYPGKIYYIAEDGHSNYREMTDYFVTYDPTYDTRRLHLQFDRKLLRYIVLSSSDDRLELQTFDKKGHITYVRKSSPTDVKTASVRRKSEEYYNLEGVKLSEKPQGGIFIHDGKKVARAHKVSDTL